MGACRLRTRAVKWATRGWAGWRKFTLRRDADVRSSRPVRDVDAKAASAAIPGLSIEAATLDWTAATLGNVMITLMLKRGTADTMNELRRIHDRWHTKHPGGIATFNIVLPSTLVPEAGAREAAAAALTAMAGHHLASTTVLLGTGFWAATIRSLLTTMFSLSNSRVPQRVTATIEEGVRFQAPYLGAGGPREADLVRAARLLAEGHVV